MSKLLRTLIVEDSEEDTFLLLRELRRGGYIPEHVQVDTASEMQAALEHQTWDIVLSDYSMPHFSASHALRVLQESGQDLPFIIVSGTIGEETAVAALQSGAHDFILKDRLARLIPAIERELREAQERQQRREAERRLYESETRFRLITENTHDLISLTNAEGKYVYVSPSFERVLGYTSSDLVGTSPLDLVHTEDRSNIENWQTYTQTEFRIHKASGEWMWIESSSFPIWIDDKALTVTSARDITARKQAEAQLQRLNRHLEILHKIDLAILAAQSPEQVCQLALEFIVSQMSAWSASILTFDLEAQEGWVFASNNRDLQSWATGEPFSLDVFPSKDIETIQTGNIRQVNEITSPAELSLEIRDLWDQGLRSYVLIPLNIHGELLGSLNVGGDHPNAFSEEFIEVCHEIANQLAIALQQTRYREQIAHHTAELEQRVVERTVELQRTKERVEVILNNSSDSIVLANADTIIQQVNPAFDAVFGYPREGLIGQSLLTLISPNNMALLLEALRTVIITGQAQRSAVMAVRQDGTLFHADIALAGVLRDGTIRDVICSFRDITDLKRVEADIRTALERERELNELKSRFTSMVSHEFRTPLSVIMSSTSLLREYSDRMTEEKRIGRFQQIEDQIRHLVDLLDDMLTISRAEVVEVETNTEAIDLTVFCEEVIAAIQQTTLMHTIQFVVQGEHRRVRVDTKLMHQALNNLLSNAIKYSPEGGVINLDLIYENHQICVYVKDKGIGIPETEHARLFEAFHRAKNVGKIQGTGLGLPIVKQAIEAHGGKISFNSKVGVGTTFEIVIPI